MPSDDDQHDFGMREVFERLPILLHADILRNILYSGVWSKYEYIQLKKKRKKS